MVLVCLTGLSVLALTSAWFWMLCWQVAVVGMTLLAPGLAAARVSRAVARGTVEAEFGQWFQTIDTLVLSGVTQSRGTK